MIEPDPIAFVYPPPALDALSLVVGARFIPIAAGAAIHQSDDGSDFEFSDGSLHEFNPG